MYKHLPYRSGVGVILINSEGLVFVGKRIDTVAKAWQMPQGGIDEDETPQQAALRELKEETGTDKAEISAESRDWYYYDLPDELIPTVWGGKFRGQKQKWFSAKFTGTDNDINLNTAHPEFCQWQWVKPAELPSLIVPFKRELYTKLVNEFCGVAG